jgi:hypothetical protein
MQDAPAGSREWHEFAGLVDGGPPIDRDHVIAIGTLRTDSNRRAADRLCEQRRPGTRVGTIIDVEPLARFAVL